MNRFENNSDAMNELLHKYISGEVTPEEAREVEVWLKEHPEAEAKVREMEDIRSALRRAVRAESVPEDLLSSVQKKTTGSGILPLNPAATRNGSRWYYSVAALLLLLVAGWFVVQSLQDPSSDDPVVAGAGPTKTLQQIMQVGMNDHLRCAVAFHQGDVPEYGMEKMKKKLAEKMETLEGDFSGLIPVIQENITEGNLLVAHKCTFGGRHYVHMILKGDESGMISLVITRKQEGESLVGHEGIARTVGNIPIYHARLDGYEISGFDADQFLVYVASDFPEETNLRMASDIAKPVTTVLKKV